MAKVSKRFLDRAKTHFRRYQKVLESARTRDVGESDTVVIVTDFLSDVLGFDKYHDVTTEFAVKSTFCDLAIRVGGEACRCRARASGFDTATRYREWAFSAPNRDS